MKYSLTFPEPWRYVLAMYTFIYSVLLACTELWQIKHSKTWSQYFRQSKNVIDWIEIVASIAIGTKCLTSKDQEPWLPSFIMAVVLVSFFQFITSMAECLPHNDIIQVEKYIHMFYQVVKRCLGLIAGFTPFLMMFAFCFQGEIKYF